MTFFRDFRVENSREMCLKLWLTLEFGHVMWPTPKIACLTTVVPNPKAALSNLFKMDICFKKQQQKTWDFQWDFNGEVL